MRIVGRGGGHNSCKKQVTVSLEYIHNIQKYIFKIQKLLMQGHIHVVAVTATKCVSERQL